MIITQLAHRMFARNVEDYASPALTERAWADPQIQNFWIAQADAVVADLTELAGHDDTEIAILREARNQTKTRRQRKTQGSVKPQSPDRISH